MTSTLNTNAAADCWYAMYCDDYVPEDTTKNLTKDMTNNVPDNEMPELEPTRVITFDPADYWYALCCDDVVSEDTTKNVANIKMSEPEPSRVPIMFDFDGWYDICVMLYGSDVGVSIGAPAPVPVPTPEPIQAPIMFNFDGWYEAYAMLYGPDASLPPNDVTNDVVCIRQSPEFEHFLGFHKLPGSSGICVTQYYRMDDGSSGITTWEIPTQSSIVIDMVLCKLHHILARY